MTEVLVIRTSAPVRLDFAGGWTDVAPFATEVGGVVVNAAIELRARVELSLRGETYQLHSDDFGGPPQESVTPWSRDDVSGADLRKAAIRRCGIGPCALRTRSDVPPGSGLGGSGALGVALVAAFDVARGVMREPADIANEAFMLEAVDAALPGGKQDQCAAAYGGFNKFEFVDNVVTATTLRLDPAFVTELAERVVVCYTGTSRVSSNTISRVMGAYSAGESTVVGALHAMVELAHRMAEALQTSDLSSVARLVSENWRLQQQLDSGMRTAEMTVLERAMSANGSMGGKAAGAGAGGSMFFLVRDRGAAIEAAHAAGAQILPFTWSTSGVREEPS